MGKKRLAAFIVALLFVLGLPFMLPSQAQAAEDENATGPVSFPFFTSVALTDANGDPLGEDVSKDAAVNVTYNFEIPDDLSDDEMPKAGDTYSFVIPEQIKLTAPISQDLTDDQGDIVAHVDVTEDGTGTITFNEFSETHKGVGGVFTISTWFNKENIANTDVVKIPFQVGSDIDYVDVHFQQPDAENEKAGSYDEKTFSDTGIFTWTVSLNENSTTIQNGHLTDVIEPGVDGSQTYVQGSFKVTDSDGKVVYDSSTSTGTGIFTYTPAVGGDTEKTGTLDYSFPDTFEGKMTVTYQTKVSDPSQYYGNSVSNTATFEHDGASPDNPSATISVSTPEFISKSGQYNQSTNKIDWTINFNKDNLSLTGVQVSDTIPDGLTLDASSIKLDGIVVASGDEPGTYKYENGVLTYNAGDILSAHTLTFSTSLPSDYWQTNQKQTFNNTVKMTADDNSYLENGATGSSSVSVASSVITKSSEYDPTTHSITWTIVVNGNARELPDATVTDTIGAGQQYLPDTFSITPADAPLNSLTGDRSFSVAGDLSSGPVLTYHFGNISSSYTITYKTELLDSESSVWAGGSGSYKNSVTLTPGGTNSESTVTKSQNVKPNVISKTAASYDYVTHEITWKIVVNNDKVPLTGVSVTDDLTGTDDNKSLNDFDLETGSIEVDGVPIGSSSDTYPYYSYDSDSKLLTIQLGDLNDETPANRTKTITFKTKLNKTDSDYNDYFGQNGSKTIDNSATLISNERGSTQAKASQTISNTLVAKTGYYESGNAYIDWAVEINQNQIALSGITLTDTLQQGLELDTSSVKLYKQSLNTDGTLTPSPTYSNGVLSVDGTAVDLTADNVSYDASTNVFTFTVPSSSDAADSSPYLLVFRTTVGAAYASGTSFSNTINLTSSKYSEETTSSEQEVAFSTSSGSAWGTTGSVTVEKHDSVTDALLSGTTFGLYDGYGNLIRVSDVTDDDGQTTFSHINYNTRYTVKEQTPSADYTSSVTSYTFELEKSGEIQLYDDQENPIGEPISSLSFSDTLKTGTITFAKLGDGGQPLEGATFTLCDTDGNPISGVATQTSDQDGKVSFTNIPYGDYTIVETTAPTGYAPLTINASLRDSNSAINSDTNTLDLGSQQDTAIGSLTVTKQGADYKDGAVTESALSGSTFEVIDSSNSQVVDTQTTGDDGTAYFANLPLGSYVLHEASASADHQTAEDVPFTITADQSASARQLSIAVTDLKKTGTISLTKVDTFTGDPLEGAEFTLYDSTGTNEVLDQSGNAITATSDSSGKITFTNIPYGDYVLKETKAASNHEVCADISFSLRDSNKAIVNGALDLGKVGDDLKTGTISLTKTDGATPLAGAEFTLSREDGGFSATATSDAQGNVSFTNVPYSDSAYTVHESKTPDDSVYFKMADVTGIYLNDQNSDVTTDGQAYSLALGNQVDVPYGSITLSKTDEKRSPLAGAEFQVLDADGNVVQTATTDQNGTITFANLPLEPTGETTYTLHESNAPADYSLADDQVVVLSNTAGGRNVTASASDTLKTGTISLTKVDTFTGDPLEGAEFTLYDSTGTNEVLDQSGNAITATSDSSGKITFTNIPYGDYVLKETKAASNHEVCADISFSLRDSNKAIVNGALDLGKVGDDLKTGTISLTKTDGATPLAGAEFTLSREDGGFSATATSDAQGNVSFTNVPYSDSAYTVHESKTPDDSVYFKMADVTGIYLNDQNSDVTTDGQAYSLALGNQVDVPYGSITLSKTDEKRSPLAGAEFQVLDADGNVVQTATTDQNGTITFANLPLEPTGETTYTLHESNAPADYSLADDQVVVLSNTAGGRNVTASASDTLKTGTISLTKVDTFTGDPLEGATFTLCDADGNPISGIATQTSGKDGKISFTNIPYGDYVLKETTTPDGYLATKAIKVSLHEDNAAVVDGALDLGKVGDAPNTPLGVIAAALPQTGDIGYSSIGWLVLAAALAFGAAGLVRHKQSKK
jgi:uncharacterized surface anchored protein